MVISDLNNYYLIVCYCDAYLAYTIIFYSCNINNYINQINKLIKETIQHYPTNQTIMQQVQKQNMIISLKMSQVC